MCGNNSLKDRFVTVAVKKLKNRFVINEIWKLIHIKLLIFWFDKGNFMLSINAEVNRTYPTCAFIKFIFRVAFLKPFMTNFGVDGKLKYTRTHIWLTCEFISVTHEATNLSPMARKMLHKLNRSARMICLIYFSMIQFNDSIKFRWWNWILMI